MSSGTTRTRAKSFRPRPIDVYKRLPVVHSVEDLEKYAERHDAEAALAPDVEPQRQAQRIQLPIPDVVEVSDYASGRQANETLPEHYIHHKPEGDDLDVIDYVPDEQDEHWFRNDAKHAADVDTSTISLDIFQIAMDTFEKLTARRGSPVPVTEAEYTIAKRASNISRSVSMTKVFLAIHHYWTEKRRAFGRPLLRQYWPQTATGDPDPHKVFRPREKERYKLRRTRGRNETGMDVYRKLDELRRGFIQAREILDLVRRREIVKREMITVATDSFQCALARLRGGDFVSKALKNRSSVLKEAGDIDAHVDSTWNDADRRNSRHIRKRRYDGTGVVSQVTGGHTGKPYNNYLVSSSQRPPSALDNQAVGYPPNQYSSSTSRTNILTMPSLGAINYIFRAGGWSLSSLAIPAFRSIPNAISKTSDRHSIVSPAFSEDALSIGMALGISIAHRIAPDTYIAMLTGHTHPYSKYVRATREFEYCYSRSISGGLPGLDVGAGAAVGSSSAASVPQGISTEVEGLTQRITLSKYTMGQVTGGGAWEDEAGLAHGIGAISGDGHGWELCGRWPERSPPYLPGYESPHTISGVDVCDELQWEGDAGAYSQWERANVARKITHSRRKRHMKRKGRRHPHFKFSDNDSHVFVLHGDASVWDIESNSEKNNSTSSFDGSYLHSNGYDTSYPYEQTSYHTSCSSGIEYDSASSDTSDSAYLTAPYVARTRISRGGRIVIDRVPLNSFTARYWRMSLPMLARRRRLRQAAAASLYRKSKYSRGGNAGTRNTLDRMYRSLYAKHAQSSSLTPSLVSGYDGDAFDVQALRAKLLGLGAKSIGLSADPLSTDAFGQGAPSVRLNIRTAYLAHSRFLPASLSAAMADAQEDGIEYKRDQLLQTNWKNSLKANTVSDSTLDVSLYTGVDSRMYNVIQTGLGPASAATRFLELRRKEWYRQYRTNKYHNAGKIAESTSSTAESNLRSSQQQQQQQQDSSTNGQINVQQTEDHTKDTQKKTSPKDKDAEKQTKTSPKDRDAEKQTKTSPTDKDVENQEKTEMNQSENGTDQETKQAAQSGQEQVNQSAIRTLSRDKSSRIQRSKRKQSARTFCDLLDGSGDSIGSSIDQFSQPFGTAVDAGYGHWYHVTPNAPIAFSSHSSHTGLKVEPAVCTGLNRKKLEDIYAMADSDDEELISVAYQSTAFMPRIRAVY